MPRRYQVLDRPSLAFRFARACLCHDIPGAWRFYRIFLYRAMKGKAAPFPLADGTSLMLPLTWPGLVTGRATEDYEPDAVAAFTAAVARFGSSVTLIDCGADVGVFSRLVMAGTANISRVIAVEPNPDPFELLAENLRERPGLSVQLRQSAVSAADGTGWLAVDPHEDHDHGAHLRAKTGTGVETKVETIDGLVGPDPSPIALKIDVEGEELNVLRGATETLAHAPGFVVQFEAHPDVASRTGIEPGECVRMLRRLGATTFTAYCERTRETVSQIDPDRRFFLQADPREIYDVVAVRPVA
jgi:FkbM family methyltransferase